MGIWAHVSRFILKQRAIILLVLGLITYGLATQIKYIQISFTEVNLLPKNHEANVTYKKFLNLFGEEGNSIILAVDADTLFIPNNFNAWSQLSNKFRELPEVGTVISIEDIQKLKHDKTKNQFVLEDLKLNFSESEYDLNAAKKALYDSLPFYENIIFKKNPESVRTVLLLKDEIVNTEKRKEVILEKIIPAIEHFEEQTGLDVKVSGMPYIRTLNAENIMSEMRFFVFLALLLTSFIFYLFFKSFRATLVTLFVVGIGVVWAFGFIGFFGYEVTVLTALIPPLIIVIGVPNAVFLINKYQQEVKKHGNRAKSLQQVIIKIGNATMMTNFTTAIGFATFIFTRSSVLREFGIIASINIMAIFVLALCIIPILYSFLSVPKKKHLNHLDRKWVYNIIKILINLVRKKRKWVYIASFLLLIISVLGTLKIKVSGSLIEDMPKGKNFFKDILYFEKELGGVMPLEFLIDTKEERGVMKLSTLKKMEKLSVEIKKIPELSETYSVVNFAKYAKQSFYRGIPSFYQLPNQQEKNWILSALKNSSENNKLVEKMVDSTGRYARITTYVKDLEVGKMDVIETQLQEKIKQIFPESDYKVSITGGAYNFVKGTSYLIKNLLLSLSLAIVLIALFIAFIFSSFRMVLVSIIPNLFPLLLTAGLMGYLGVPIKPSTLLVFSIAFGISVDDTIHFLAKFRQELMINQKHVRKSVFESLKETGVSMFYTSIILFFGFLVFTVSSFGGTIALGGLVSLTLLFAMLSNLVLLPSLILTLENFLSTRKAKKKMT